MPIYKSIRDGDPSNPLDKCSICEKTFRKGDWIREGFITVSHNKCYRKLAREKGYVSPRGLQIRMRKVGTDLLMRELQKMARAGIQVEPRRRRR